MNPPFYYNQINTYNSYVTPSTMHIKNTGISRFFKRYLLQRAMSVFKWTLPETWAKNYFMYSLYCNGFVAIIKTDKFGVIPQACTLSGYDVFFQPTQVYIANPLINKALIPRIGKECTLIRLQPDYGGILDIVEYYGDLMALTAEACSMNLANSHFAYVFAASNKSSAESFKKLYDQISSGEVCAVVDKALLNGDGSPTWQAFTQNVGQNYIADKLLVDLRKIANMFDTEVGIPNSNTEKKERMLTDEIDSNNVETHTKCDMWLEELKESCQKANNMFGINMSVNWRYKPETAEGGEDNESNTNDHGNV